MQHLGSFNADRLHSHARACFGVYLAEVDNLNNPQINSMGGYSWSDVCLGVKTTQAELIRRAPLEMSHHLGRVAMVAAILQDINALEQLIEFGFEGAQDILDSNPVIADIRPNPLSDYSVRNRLIIHRTPLDFVTLMAGMPIHPSFITC